MILKWQEFELLEWRGCCVRVNYLALEQSTPLSIHVLISLFSSCHFHADSEMDIYLSVILYIIIIWGEKVACVDILEFEKSQEVSGMSFLPK